MVHIKLEEEDSTAAIRALSLDHGPPPPPSSTMDDPRLTIHPVPTNDGVIVRVQPPTHPTYTDPRLSHIPCDIVLVIDVSGSMQLEAPAKMNSDDGKLISSERFGLSVLDLTKHAARTILSTLDQWDRLGIVTFSSRARVVQKLLPMTPANKKLAHSNIEGLIADSTTNLWHGIMEGINLFDGKKDTGRVPAIMILTDGLPNYMSPAQGFVPKIRAYESLPATIHTFGFGYEIKSGLLKSIAEVGSGNYAFIPDAGMIGTVFVHAVSHIQSTYATRCTLKLATPKSIGLRTTAGQSIGRQEHEEADCKSLIIDIGNLQYGQSRDLYLENTDTQGRKAMFILGAGESTVTATLTYSHMKATEYRVHAEKDLLEGSDLSKPEAAYHQSRSMLCNFLSSLFPLQSDGEYETRKEIDIRCHQPALQHLLDTIPARLYTDEYNRSLMEDLGGDLPSGQVSLALSRNDYFSKWGCHYFFSLWNAHAKQLCNSFKDPGPLMYNQNEFFAQCRNALDRAFDTIPPPVQSCVSAATTRNINMSRLNSRAGPCFTGSSKVTLADGRELPIRKLRRNEQVCTPVGSRRVAAVLKTMVRGIAMCKVGNLVVTPWHPVKIEDGMPWTFPVELLRDAEQPQVVLFSGPIYSVLLQPDCNIEAHILQIGSVWAVTLGHGLIRGDDIRAHKFLGDYGKVKRALKRLQPGKDGVALSSGVKRRDGLVCGFKKYVRRQHYTKMGGRTNLH